MKKINRFDVFIYGLIIANIIAMVLESHQSIQKQFSKVSTFLNSFLSSFSRLNTSIEL